MSSSSHPSAHSATEYCRESRPKVGYATNQQTSIASHQNSTPPTTPCSSLSSSVQQQNDLCPSVSASQPAEQQPSSHSSMSMITRLSGVLINTAAAAVNTIAAGSSFSSPNQQRHSSQDSIGQSTGHQQIGPTTGVPSSNAENPEDVEKYLATGGDALSLSDSGDEKSPMVCLMESCVNCRQSLQSARGDVQRLQAEMLRLAGRVRDQQYREDAKNLSVRLVERLDLLQVIMYRHLIGSETLATEERAQRRALEKSLRGIAKRNYRMKLRLQKLQWLLTEEEKPKEFGTSVHGTINKPEQSLTDMLNRPCLMSRSCESDYVQNSPRSGVSSDQQPDSHASCCFYLPHHHHHQRQSLNMVNGSDDNSSIPDQNCVTSWTAEEDSSYNREDQLESALITDVSDDIETFVVEDGENQLVTSPVESNSTMNEQASDDSDDRGLNSVESNVLHKEQWHRSDQTTNSTVLVFVYGTLKRGYCNHYNLETDGIKYFQDGITLHPYVMYLDSSNRSRPCLTDGSLCPVDALIDGELMTEAPTGQQESEGRNKEATQQLVCPFCCYQQKRQQKRQEPKQLDNSVLARTQQEPQDNQDLSPTSKYRNSKHWGLPVRGELYIVNSSLLETLDRFERVPAHYLRRTIAVRGLLDGESHKAEVYFNRTSCQRWCELLHGQVRLLRDYTLDHHRLYRPRTGNCYGRYFHDQSINQQNREKKINASG